MRLLLILILASGVLFAKTKDTCYSVQLSSFVKKKNSTYNFEEQNYPQSCKMFEFSNMNAIRCGCFKKYGDAKKQKKVFSALYKDISIVKTYSYRFAPKKSLAKQKQSLKVVTPVIPKQEKELKEVPTIDASSIMENVVVQGNVNLEYQKYITRPSGTHSNNYTASAELEIAYTENDFKAFAQFRAQQDYYDLEGSSQHNDRSYLRINELYAQYDLENSQILFGKNIRFWGALEVHNLTDGFNITDFRSDPTENDKVGSWNAAYTIYTDTGELALIAKINEENRKMPGQKYVYYPFQNTINTISYDSDVKTEESANRPSIYLKYSGSADSEYTLDYSFIFENGYDSQRYYDKPVGTANEKIQENAYLVNKLMTYNTLVINSTLYKLEATYVDVIDDDNIADYYNIGLGIEHTLTQVHGEADLGLLAEYYKYETINRKSNQYTSNQLFEIFQNDIFFGARYSFNEGNDASIVGGGIFDLDEDEQVYYVEYESRINDMFKLNLDYRQTEPSSNSNVADKTALELMGKQKRISVKVGYYF